MPGYAAGMLAAGHVSDLQSDGQDTSPALAPALQQPTQNCETWREKRPSSYIFQEVMI